MYSSELIFIIEKFDIQRQLWTDHFKTMNDLQQSFVTDFPVIVINNLTIDEYIEGKRSHSSFCYRLERQLDVIGRMRGSTSAVFVLYYGIKGDGSDAKYRFTNKLGKVSDEYEALAKVKQEIISLIQAGAVNNRKAIQDNRLADLFKYKILGTYFPDRYLNLYSHRHLNYFIGELGLNPGDKTVLDKQDVLLEFKNSNKTMVNWSNYEFNSFLYNTFGRPPSNDEQEKKQDALPAIEKVRPEIVVLNIIEPDSNKIKTGGGNPKPDYKEQQERNNRLGKRGENIVINWEKAFLRSKKFPLNKLIHASVNDDRLGYDIQSLDENGKTKYIEVKSTRRLKGNANFIMTENEIEKARDLENYFIYVVFEAHTLNPKIWQIKEPIKEHKDKLKLSPINYRVEISVNE